MAQMMCMKYVHVTGKRGGISALTGCKKTILAFFFTKAFKLGLIQANPDTQQIPQHPSGTRTALLKPSGAAGSD